MTCSIPPVPLDLACPGSSGAAWPHFLQFFQSKYPFKLSEKTNEPFEPEVDYE
jgi:hypothetical protein